MRTHHLRLAAVALTTLVAGFATALLLAGPGAPFSTATAAWTSTDTTPTETETTPTETTPTETTPAETTPTETTPPAETTPPPAPQPTPPTPVTAAAPPPPGPLPATKQCTSRRTFTIRLRVPKGAKVTSAEVRVNGRKTTVKRADRLKATIDLRYLPKGRATVAIKLKLADGRTITGTRTYRTCTPKRTTAKAPKV